MQENFTTQQEQPELEQFQLRQAYCIEHPQNQIINFCKNPLCLMPLCKECIKLHALEHYQKGTQPEFDTIDTVVIETYQQIEMLWQRYQLHKESHEEYQEKLKNHKKVLQQQLTIAKDKIIHIVERYFESIWQKTEQKEDFCVGSQQEPLTKQMEFLLQKSNQMEQYMNKLNSDNFLKYIILILNSSEVIEEDLFAKDSNATLKQFSNELMDVTIDESFLKSIKSNLTEYVNIQNANLYTEAKPKKSKDKSQQSFISAVPSNLTSKFSAYIPSQSPQKIHSQLSSQQQIPQVKQSKKLHQQSSAQYNANANATAIIRQQQAYQSPIYAQSMYIQPQKQDSFNVSNQKILHQRMPSQGMTMPTEMYYQQQQIPGIKQNNISGLQQQNIANQKQFHQFKRQETK